MMMIVLRMNIVLLLRSLVTTALSLRRMVGMSPTLLRPLLKHVLAGGESLGGIIRNATVHCPSLLQRTLCSNRRRLWCRAQAHGPIMLRSALVVLLVRASRGWLDRAPVRALSVCSLEGPLPWTFGEASRDLWRLSVGLPLNRYLTNTQLLSPD
ncbi:hypothetical protein Pmar_PMAR016080 [Perkinsus marinus ATCC 50983]|uniref:Secreted protein n=1 Tax=Perkinsus marinus (strain ATCC 50983 / TXsc) TaxID=423536 RepID=C5LYZ5_PERM5|nr:hypothetical protein Pmar_PMAR016080 [Perkinsus marinus ATCC 50983]EEQ98004.1 hypothetical protein Pmar_PMAR016080 [Perkinsus marinus ATCC 50983]|eukprot:XP_002765287.1 hypothetical protein Pmar_PMAR016080 [Perkinsus marinus ATCC 50983]